MIFMSLAGQNNDTQNEMYSTTPKTDMSPKEWPFQKESHLPTTNFSGANCLIFSECSAKMGRSSLGISCDARTAVSPPPVSKATEGIFGRAQAGKGMLGGWAPRTCFSG